MRQPKNQTTKLPKKLMEELGVIDGQKEKERKTKGIRNPADRKTQRKAERVAKKAERRRPRSVRKELKKRIREAAEVENAPEAAQLKAAKRKTTGSGGAALPGPLKSILKKTQQTTNVVVPGRKKKEASSSSESESERSLSPLATASKSRSAVLTAEDAEIAALERKLGIRNKKKKLNEDGDDAFDSLLGTLDGDVEDERTDKKRKRDEAEEWLNQKRKKAKKIGKDSTRQNGRASDEYDVGSDSDGELSVGTDENIGSEDDTESGLFDSDDAEMASDAEANLSPPRRMRENPYVPPKIAGAEKSSEQYIPPALRKVNSSEKDDLSRLRRQAQGLLNRLTEGNLISIVSDVEKLYRAHPRQHVTSVLTSILVDLIADKSSLQDTFLILHAGFITAVHRIIGTDFGATILDRVVERFDSVRRVYGSGSDSATSGEGGARELVNLVSLLAELYNLQMIGSTLIFDLVRLFLSKLTEAHTELLLKIMRSSGPQLRQDDPSALRDIVLLLRQQISTVGEANMSVRTKFMVETINDLKNNKIRTGHGVSAMRSETLIRMKKILGSLHSRKLQSTEPLRVSLEDLRNKDKRGNWWLPAAASGSNKNSRTDGTVPERAELDDSDDNITEGEGGGGIIHAPNLHQLAKEQNMNTDIRRAIFVSIMSATDHRDAQQRLNKLHLKRAQELEIPRVLIHCAGAEKGYNPYYTLIARKLCGDRRLKMAFQFTLWGVFREMGETGDDDDELDHHEENDDHQGSGDEMNIRKIFNLAKLYGTLVSEGILGLGILKTLNLTYLQHKARTFVELLFITIFLSSQRPSSSGDTRDKKGSDNKRDDQAIKRIFMTIKDDNNTNNTMLARGIQYFLQKVVSQSDVIGEEVDRKTVRWGCRIAGGVLKRIIMAEGETESLG
ncbi:MAG: hypothetical protein M1823_002930 [Watsoniomyces obsoletus]|nr:MAG: hypothetical protein M1823_002930 [Watsoniomyces obsoletus]